MSSAIFVCQGRQLGEHLQNQASTSVLPVNCPYLWFHEYEQMNSILRFTELSGKSFMFPPP